LSGAAARTTCGNGAPLDLFVSVCADDLVILVGDVAICFGWCSLQ
jgi:hypothetical protein